MKTTKKHISAVLALIIYSSIALAHFGFRGPTGGSVSCGIVNDTIAYLGTVNGGVFFSTKQSLAGWSLKPVGLKSGKITALAHTGLGNPTDFNTGVVIFAGTADSGIFRYTGLVGSSDRYWEKVNTGLTNLKIKSLVALGTNTLIAGTDGNGVFKTTNNGASWTASNTGLSGSAIITSLVKAGSRLFATSQAGGVFKSDNNGATWSDFNDVNTLNIAGTNALSYNVTTDELLVLNSGGLFIITSASTTSSIAYAACQTGLPGGTAIRSIANNGANWFLATDGGVYKSATGTISWATANTGLTPSSALDVNVVVPIPFSSSRLLAGTNSEGVYKSSASSISWSANNTSFNNLETYSMATSGAQLVISATEKGVFRSPDFGTTNTRANNGLTDSLNVTGLEFSGSTLFASTKNAGVFVSADSGKNWSAFNSGLFETNIKKIIVTGNTLFIISSTNKLYQSTGYSWTAVQGGLSGGVVPTSVVAYGNNLLLGTLGNGVYKKSKGATIWTAINTGLSNQNVTAVTANGKKLFAGTNGAGVFVSDTATINWTAVTPTSIAHTTTMGLDGSKIQAMTSLGSYIFISYKGGLLASSDNGTTWIQGGNQFNLPSYTNVYKIAFVDSKVYVTTDYNCLYANNISEIPLIAIAIVTKNVSCKGLANGAAYVTASAGTAPYTYFWSDGTTENSASNLAAKTYTVIVKDAASTPLTYTTTITMTEPDTLMAHLMTNQISSNGSSEGSISSDIMGGTSPYYYLWSNGETTAAIINLTEGEYSLVAKDANGCEVIANTTVAPLTTGINTLSDNSSEVSLFPNPNNGNFIINLGNNEQIKTIEIINSVGVTIQRITDTKEQLMKLNVTYPSGIYFVKITSGNEQIIKKIIIQ